VNKLGADHVGLGTDMEGVGKNWSVNDYGHVRSVLHYNGLPIDARSLTDDILVQEGKKAPAPVVAAARPIVQTQSAE